MKKKIMAFYDSESDYTEDMADYLKKQEGFPYELHTYTEQEKLLSFGKEEPIEVLVVAESDYTYEVAGLPVGKTLLLNESGTIAGENIHNINKYQKAENIYREITGEIAAMIPEEEKSLRSCDKAKIIGLYSPIRRCLQTSFALTLGQALSEKKKVLYISFEHYAGWNQLLNKSIKGDLAALLYFLQESEERFAVRLQSVTMQIGRLHYIPPVYAGQNLIYAKGPEWVELVEKIAEYGGYDYVILDLSESIQGIFELLKHCDRIYTITKEDPAAQGKIAQYEELLRDYRCEEILEKTSKKLLPVFTGIPERLEQYTRGELADYIRKLISEELEAA